MIGHVLGSYRVISRIGAGGMGTIWLAEHQLLGSRAAIKVLHPDMSAQRRIVQRFFDEARAATRIHDPGIVTVIDFGWHEGAAYLVMEFLVGESLADRLKTVDRMPALQAVRLIQQCAIAMAAAHERGIVHRDLKPDNIYLVADPAIPGGERIKILDFGIAKLIDDADASHSRTQTGMIMGTPAFMSPEQCRGAGGVDHRTDIYALGCVLFNMVCGRPPFIAGTPGDLLVAQIGQAPPTPSALVPGLPAELDALVATCLEKAADHRFASMTELVRAGAAITGDNLSIVTIPPRREATDRVDPSEPEPGATVATAAPSTTLQGSTGQASQQGSSGRTSVLRTRPWRGGMFIALGVLVAAAGIVLVVTHGPSRPTNQPAVEPEPARPIAVAVDAGASSPDAPSPDAEVSVQAGSATTRTPARPSTAKKPGASAHGRTGSATAGSAAGAGSGSQVFDPYSER